MRAILSVVMLMLATFRAAGQVDAPAEVAASAVAAVKALGEQLVLGRHQVAIERMYPELKKRLAKQEGGMDKLEARLADAFGRKMSEQGVQLISFRPEGRPIAYEVGAGKEVVAGGDGPVERMVFRQWLLLIPTVAEYRTIRPVVEGGVPKSLIVIGRGFQVAVADKGSNDWTFIYGAGLTVPDLRRMFFTLPETMVLPEIKWEHKEIQ
jgi:hypothetical protein